MLARKSSGMSTRTPGGIWNIEPSVCTLCYYYAIVALARTKPRLYGGADQRKTSSLKELVPGRTGTLDLLAGCAACEDCNAPVTSQLAGGTLVIPGVLCITELSEGRCWWTPGAILGQ